MNKANVFLLVVVSSLLTYISTATQPAATASVAQEKWEYYAGWISTYDTSFDYLLNSAHFPKGFTTVAGQKDDISITLNWIDEITGLTQTPYESLVQIKPDTVSSTISALGMGFLRDSLRDGWEVFQVDDRRPGRGVGAGTTIYHLRRRVQ